MIHSEAPLVAQWVKNLPAMQETPVRFLGQEDLERWTVTHSHSPGGFHGLYSPWGRKESDMTEHPLLSPWGKCLSQLLFRHLIVSTLHNPMDCSMPGIPVPHHLLEFAHVHVHCIGNGIPISSSVIPFSFCLQSFPASASLLVNRLFASGGQSIGS